MPLTKTLIKHGNSLALVIDKPILELLGITAETRLEVTTEGGALVMRPVGASGDDEAFEAALEMVHQRFGRAMRRLAE